MSTKTETALVTREGEGNPIVMRLLTPEEIDNVSGGHTSHAMGIGSSYSQAAGYHFSQGMFSSYSEGGGGEMMEETA